MRRPSVNIWLLVRALMLVLGMLSANSFVPSPQSPFVGGSITLLLVFFVFGVISMVFVLGLQATNPRSAAVWTKPDWHENPFSLKQPLQFFHMSGYYLIAAGGGAIVLAHIRHLSGLEPLLPIALGVGVLVGIRCCELLYRRKFGSP